MFLSPADLTLGQFVYVIRKRLALSPERALFLFVGNSLPTTGSLMREIFASHADEDGFLYCTYSGESSFGAGAGAGAPSAAFVASAAAAGATSALAAPEGGAAFAVFDGARTGAAVPLIVPRARTPPPSPFP